MSFLTLITKPNIFCDSSKTLLKSTCYLKPQDKGQCLNYAEEHQDKPEEFWKQLLWTDDVKMELLAKSPKVCFGRKEQHLKKKQLTKC